MFQTHSLTQTHTQTYYETHTNTQSVTHKSRVGIQEVFTTRDSLTPRPLKATGVHSQDLFNKLVRPLKTKNEKI